MKNSPLSYSLFACCHIIVTSCFHGLQFDVGRRMLSFVRPGAPRAAATTSKWLNMFAKSGTRPAASSSRLKRPSRRAKRGKSWPSAAFTFSPSAPTSISCRPVHQEPRQDRTIRPDDFLDFQSAVQHAGQGRSAHPEGARSACRARRLPQAAPDPRRCPPARSRGRSVV